MAITDRNLSVGTKLYAKYKGTTHTAEVVLNPNASGDRAIGYQVDGKDELFKSPSAAGIAITEKACNGWAFWTVGEPPIAPEPTAAATKPAKAPRARKPKTTTTESGETAPEIPEGTIDTHANGKFACEVCGAEFDDEGGVTSHYIEAHAS
jgi:hypothetical protein